VYFPPTGSHQLVTTKPHDMPTGCRGLPYFYVETKNKSEKIPQNVGFLLLFVTSQRQPAENRDSILHSQVSCPAPGQIEFGCVHYSSASVAQGLFVIILKLITTVNDNSRDIVNGGWSCRPGAFPKLIISPKSPQPAAGGGAADAMQSVTPATTATTSGTPAPPCSSYACASVQYARAPASLPPPPPPRGHGTS
jgi:hypothetical protein